MTAPDIIQNGIPDYIDLFIIPGGADRPYTQKLNGIGNKRIREYVETGGTYLGICAGAYYGCGTIEFQKGTSSAICENRELQFFDGIGTGCLTDIAPSRYDQTLQSACTTPIDIEKEEIQTLYWGGCTFNAPIASNTKIIARYNKLDTHPPAI
ncbi:MAG: biotin--protein ligase, partial [Phototrophicales bacterium]